MNILADLKEAERSADKISEDISHLVKYPNEVNANTLHELYIRIWNLGAIFRNLEDKLDRHKLENFLAKKSAGMGVI